jgi:hypothetical protein
VSFLVVVQSNLEVPKGLMNYAVFRAAKKMHKYSSQSFVPITLRQLFVPFVEYDDEAMFSMLP